MTEAILRVLNRNFRVIVLMFKGAHINKQSEME
jgi:hypothetical protein